MASPAALWPPQQQQSRPAQPYNFAGYQQQYSQQQYPQQQYPQQQQPHQQYPQQPYPQQQNPQQQYPQQQYPQQVYSGQPYAQHPHPQQQYANLQPGDYQQAHQYPNATSPTQAQQASQPVTHTCYNCGSPDHWAQNCPEPRREVPAGLVSQPNYPRPPKRQKTNAPVITKYPLPPHAAPPSGPPKGYGATPYGQTGYAQYPGVSGPPTPVSAQSPSHHQWQQPLQNQQYQQHYQQGYPYQPGGSYQQQPYTAAIPPTPSTYYGSQTPNQQYPPWPQYNAGYDPHNPRYQQPSGVPMQPYSGASPSSVVSPAAGYQWNQYQGPIGHDPKAAYQGSPAPNTLTQSQSSTPKPPLAAVVDIEVEEDDLDKLDVPDIPSGGALIDLTGRPLSANFVVAEAIPLLPPEPDNDGCCRSKYTDRGRPDIIGRNVKDTSYWEEFSKDPIFISIPDDGKIVPIDYLRSRFDPPQANKDQILEPEDDTDDPHQESKFKLDGEDMGDVMDSLEHALNVGRPKPLQLSSGKGAVAVDQTSTLNSDPWTPSALDTEAMLAALGVTGAPKPVRAPARPYPPPSALEPSSQASPNGTSRSRSGSPIIHDPNLLAQRRHGSNSGAENRGREMNPNSLLRGSYSTNYAINEQPSPGSTERSYSQNFELPPPPPPALRKPSFYDSTVGSPLSAGSNHGTFNGFGNHTSENGNIDHKYLTDEHLASSVKLRVGGSNNRKRDFDNRDESSEESETQGKRQADDVTPKLKRRQPKVAEAYSRRW